MNILSKVSFVIPVYNCEKYLSKCVEGIKNISAVDYEVILVDDGSKDQSGLICDRLSSGDTRIFCIHQENQGVSSARNAGLKAATGDYICFIDSDDEIESENLNRLFEKLEKTSDIDMVIFGLSFDYYFNKRLYYRYELEPPLKGVIDDTVWLERLYDLYATNALNPIWNKVFRRDLLTEHKLYFREDMFLYEDLEYSIRCMEYCGKILFEPEIIYHYRQSEDERNSGRRLASIDHLHSLTDKIENILYEMVRTKRMDHQECKIKKILMSLYLVLAREKIAVSDKKQIQLICEDFAEWYPKHTIDLTLQEQEYVGLLLQKRVGRLILNREYTKIRHRIAVLLKSSRVYQKLKG